MTKSTESNMKITRHGVEQLQKKEENKQICANYYHHSISAYLIEYVLG